MDVSLRPTRSHSLLRGFFIWTSAVFILIVFPLVLFWPITRSYLQAAAVLRQLDGKAVPNALRPIAALPVTTRTITISSAAGAVPARLYSPLNRPDAPGLVIVPGIHYLGMDEPRLVAFARSMAGCDLRVLTPELPGSRDYRIVPADVQAIGNSVQWLQRATGRPVGLMGLSFSGGLALMAAARPPFSNQVSFVFSVGAHDDLYRVAMFYATGADPLPDGDVEREIPNAYGPLVLEYEHLEDFANPRDTKALRPVLRARLYDNPILEKRLIAKLTATQKDEYDRLIDVSKQALSLAESNKKHIAEMAAVSPHGHLAGLHVPVFLLHGRGDNLIPFAEAEWLALDLPRGALKELLISPLIGHVTVNGKKSSILDKWKLLHLLAQIMERASYA